MKQGCFEDKLKADGPDFNYYAHVAKLNTMRLTLFRANRGTTRKIMTKDISTAFLQSDPYPDGQKKYICFRHPVTGQWEYFEQSGPIYGEASSRNIPKNIYLTREELIDIIGKDAERIVFEYSSIESPRTENIFNYPDGQLKEDLILLDKANSEQMNG